jgi:Flp pilus assembly protein TadD
MTMKSCSAVALALLLAACAGREPRPVAPAPPPAPARDWVAEIHAQAASLDNAVVVEPLADPAVEDLRRLAQSAEAAGDFATARTGYERSLALRPEDPVAWQAMAELSLRAGQWRLAASEAQRSYDLGPRSGPLCLRNWLTIRASRIELGDTANLHSAEAQAAACAVKPIIRM